MPLLDHFHPPLTPARRWESFHAAWATEIMATLNRGVLPADYYAESQVHLGSRVEIVASFRQDASTPPESSANGGTVAVQTWSPPLTTLTMPAVFPDEIEVQVYATATGATLVAAIELISPGNKDRPETRRAFAVKCAGYLQMGIGLVIVDIVTGRKANLHDELIRLLGLADEFRFPAEDFLYTVAYRPVRRQEEGDQVDVLPYRLAINKSMPVVPLPLRGGPTVPVDLESSYVETLLRSRI